MNNENLNRKRESILLKIAGIWNIITGSITLFYYSSWIKGQLAIDPRMNNEQTMATKYIYESIDGFVIMYGLLFICVGAINYYLSTKIKTGLIQKNIIIWCIIWTTVSFFGVDIVGFVLYFIFIINTLIRNKALQTMT